MGYFRSNPNKINQLFTFVRVWNGDSGGGGTKRHPSVLVSWVKCGHI